MIAAAEHQLATSPDYDIATRAVCDAVGVTQPVLYRLFGDKRGLLDALADHGLERYAAIKDAQGQTSDPVADLRAGWDAHLRFGAENPALYQLMFTPRPWSRAVARQHVLDLLESTLVRCAAAGALTTEPAVAAQLILSANVGIALNQIAHPELFAASTLSRQMWDTVFSHLLVEPPEREVEAPLQAAALRLRSQLALTRTQALEPAESALLDHWLLRLTTNRQ